MHCVTGEAPRAKFCATAQIRSRARAATVAVTPLPTGKARARFSSAQRGITPGQFLVLYNGDIVLGGGAICSPRNHPMLASNYRTPAKFICSFREDVL